MEAWKPKLGKVAVPTLLVAGGLFASSELGGHCDPTTEGTPEPVAMGFGDAIDRVVSSSQEPALDDRDEKDLEELIEDLFNRLMDHYKISLPESSQNWTNKQKLAWVIAKIFSTLDADEIDETTQAILNFIGNSQLSEYEKRIWSEKVRVLGAFEQISDADLDTRVAGFKTYGEISCDYVDVVHAIYVYKAGTHAHSDCDGTIPESDLNTLGELTDAMVEDFWAKAYTDPAELTKDGRLLMFNYVSLSEPALYRKDWRQSLEALEKSIQVLARVKERLDQEFGSSAVTNFFEGKNGRQWSLAEQQSMKSLDKAWVLVNWALLDADLTKEDQRLLLEQAKQHLMELADSPIIQPYFRDAYTGDPNENIHTYPLYYTIFAVLRAYGLEIDSTVSDEEIQAALSGTIAHVEGAPNLGETFSKEMQLVPAFGLAHLGDERQSSSVVDIVQSTPGVCGAPLYRDMVTYLTGDIIWNCPPVEDPLCAELDNLQFCKIDPSMVGVEPGQ